MLDNINTEYHDVGNAVWECKHCGALMWYQERKNKSKDTLNPEFQRCCGNDKVTVVETCSTCSASLAV
jgi:hypothetical protein